MDCLRYLLDLLDRGHKFKILYDGNHCIGVSETKLFDFGGFFKKDLINGFSWKGGSEYLPIEDSLEKERVCLSFKLTEKEFNILKDYYESSTRVYNNEK